MAILEMELIVREPRLTKFERHAVYDNGCYPGDSTLARLRPAASSVVDKDLDARVVTLGTTGYRSMSEALRNA
jgi:hypothetical protein